MKTKKTNIFILLLSQMYQGGGCRSPGLVFSCVWPAFKHTSILSLSLFFFSIYPPLSFSLFGYLILIIIFFFLSFTLYTYMLL